MINKSKCKLGLVKPKLCNQEITIVESIYCSNICKSLYGKHMYYRYKRGYIG